MKKIKMLVAITLLSSLSAYAGGLDESICKDPRVFDEYVKLQGLKKEDTIDNYEIFKTHRSESKRKATAQAYQTSIDNVYVCNYRDKKFKLTKSYTISVRKDGSLSVVPTRGGIEYENVIK